ncbi:hypothetical protein ABB37_05581 [Leptomonas pyrrhocoris]|uniref:Uncharacterized protein n=1 Tax=Leptomonas pyrrhocoris TaxID=157538 RepID=A0A0M9FZE6_LEPPY|nr:hypothetical protein ABB37_05581 [Leptomonas pyrrhocoris]KPA79047.1 hypothetical protein ABB37_05581 [Leptomonas pyrrhocoris]|eukprot:XP_015657486.1 hypothetical protein ABB37_05581 [Leptomonas pyrrhocoris]
MAASPSLLIFLNGDVGMERPYRTALPASVDTLAELCQFLTSRIPPRPGEDAVGRGYRFLYSVFGKPLWRVKECVEAGTIVLSVGPGFLARRPAAITDNASATASPAPAAAAAAAATTSVVDLATPDRLAATPTGGDNTHPDSNNGFLLDASPAASPPVKLSVEDNAYRPPPAFSSTAAAAHFSTASGRGSTVNVVPFAGAAGKQGRESIDVAWPPAPSVRRPSQTDERDRLVSITLNPAARGARASSGGPITQSTPVPHVAAGATAGGAIPASHLFTPPNAQATAGEATGGPRENQTFVPPPPLPRKSFPAAATATTAAEAMGDALPRGMVFLAQETHALPARPSFTPASTALAALLPPLQPLASNAISSSLQYFLLRKWSAYQKLHSMPPADLIAGEAMSQRFNSITAACNSSGSSTRTGGVGGDRGCRVVVSGPPLSGVSTTAAFLVRHLLRTLQLQPQHRLHNTLVIALDFHLLFGPQVTSAPGLPRVLLDLASLYQLVVRSVMDAVVAQRPSLREAGPLLSQLWDLVIKPNVEPKAAPNFTTYAQAAALVGGDVLAQWTRLVAQIFPILQAACRAPETPALRDAALDLIFYAIPAEIASSLNFSGVLYAMDGAEALTRCYAERVTRPAGDLGPLLQALAADPRVHLVLSCPSTIPPRALFIPGLMAHVSTIGLVTRAALNHMHFPQLLRSGRREYPVETFLGCPGYLTLLNAVVRPLRKNLSTPTTAYSAYYQQHYERSPAEGYAVRIDSKEVSHALDKLLAVVQDLPLT